MLECQQKEIDGQVFSVEMLDSKTARAAFVRLSRLLGPALAALASSKESNLLNIDHTVALEALSKLTASMSEEDLEYFCDRFRAKTKIPATTQAGAWVPLQDTIFSGKMTLLFKWLWFCLEVNYSDFLAAFRAMKPLTSTPAPRGTSVPIPAHVDWEVWRVVSSGKFHATLDEVQTKWSIVDLWDANVILNAYAYAESKAAEKANVRS